MFLYNDTVCDTDTNILDEAISFNYDFKLINHMTSDGKYKIVSYNKELRIVKLKKLKKLSGIFS